MLSLQSTPRNFQKIKKAAKGQTVYFNAWGGDTKINRYIKWVKTTLSDRHDVTLVHVKLTNTADAVSRILAEKSCWTKIPRVDRFVMG